MSKILLVGNDLALLMTRSAVLARTSASIVYCYAIEAIDTIESENFNLVVLCHSLTEKQISEITQMTHHARPRAMVLRVVLDISQETAADVAGSEAISSADPDLLIRRTTELLRQMSPSAR